MYWDRLVAFDRGVGNTGYMARGPADGSRLWIHPQTHGRDTINGQASGGRPNNAFRVEGSRLITEPRTTLADIRAGGFEINRARLNDRNVINRENVATGTVLETNKGTFTVVKLGDLTGTGDVGLADMALIRRHLMEVRRLRSNYYRAANLTRNENPLGLADMALMQRHLMGVNLISL